MPAHRTGSGKVRVIIFGEHSPDWMTALEPGAPVWRRLHNVEEVLKAKPGGSEIPRPKSPEVRTVVIPLMEDHIASCPKSFAHLTPSEQALRVLRDKSELAAFVRANGLSQLCPEAYSSPDVAQFPCVLKRTDLNGGVGVRVVCSAEELRNRLDEEPWRDHPYLLQSFHGDAREGAAHCVCQDGRILWHCSYAYAPAAPDVVCCAGRPATRMTEPASRLAEFEAILGPLAYSGPCCIDYKVTASGQTIVLEINPRFGGSLMRPAHVEDLQGSLSAIISLATPAQAHRRSTPIKST